MSLPTVHGEFRLVDDPELKFTQSGKAVANVRLAASRRRKTQSGEWEDAEKAFVNASLWETDAEQVVEAAQKGDKVLATGSLSVRTYDRNDGTKGTAVDLLYAKIAVLQKKGAGRQQAGQPAPEPSADPWAVPADTAPPF